MNNQETIKQGLAQFIGAYLEHSPLKAEQSKHDTVAMLAEEILFLATNDQKQINGYILKPALRLVYNYLIQLSAELDSLIDLVEKTGYSKDSAEQLRLKKLKLVQSICSLKELIDTSQLERDDC